MQAMRLGPFHQQDAGMPWKHISVSLELQGWNKGFTGTCLSNTSYFLSSVKTVLHRNLLTPYLDNFIQGIQRSHLYGPQYHTAWNGVMISLHIKL